MIEQAELGRITVSVEPSQVSVAFFGELDESNSHTLAGQVPVSDGRVVRLNLSEVTFASSAFLRELIQLHRAAGDDGGGFQVTSMSPVVARLLEMTGLDALLLTGPDQ